MDSPSWSDTLRAAIASSCSCLPCLRSNDAPSDNEYDDPLTPQGSFAVRRARADELEGLLADANNDEDAAADADAISLHSHLGPHGRRRVPPKTPRHISLWGYSLFGKGKEGVKLPEGGSDPLHRSARRRTGPSSSTTDLLAAAANEPVPEQLTEEDVERRARRKARKEMRRLAKAVAAQQDPNTIPPSPHPAIPAPFLHISTPSISSPPPDDDDEADLDGLTYARRPQGVSGLSASGSQTHSRSSGRSSGSGSNRGPYVPASPIPYSPTTAIGPPIPKTHKSSSRSKKSTSDRRSTRSKSSATSSTLASPSAATFPASPSPLGRDRDRDDFGAFVAAGKADDFDGAPGGFEADASFDGAPGGFDGFDGTPGGFSIADAHAEEDAGSPWEHDVVREALPSPGLTSTGRPRMGSLNSGRIAGF